MTTTEFTIHVKEINEGVVTFTSKQEAEEWLNDPENRDWDLVKWVRSETSSTRA